jgi:hypothetical protein
MIFVGDGLKIFDKKLFKETTSFQTRQETGHLKGLDDQSLSND